MSAERFLGGKVPKKERPAPDAVEQRDSYLKHSSESIGKTVGDVGRDMRETIRAIRDNPDRLNEYLADLTMYADFLERQERPIQEEEENAAFDTLTGLPNRRHFREVLGMNVSHALRQEQIGNPQELHVLFIDLDHFKEVNDDKGQGGHDVGDLYLKTVSTRMKEALHREYDVVARNGGDEFAALLLDCDEDAARKIAERVRIAVAEGSAEAKRAYEQERGVVLPDNVLNVTASIGVASLEGDGDSVEGLLKRADQAMYSAKEKGRDRVVIYSDERDGDGDGHGGMQLAANG